MKPILNSKLVASIIEMDAIRNDPKYDDIFFELYHYAFLSTKIGKFSNSTKQSTRIFLNRHINLIRDALKYKVEKDVHLDERRRHFYENSIQILDRKLKPLKY